MADEAKKEAPAAPPAEGEEGEKKGGNLIMVIIIIAVVVVLEAAVAYLMTPKPPSGSKEKDKEIQQVGDSLKAAAEAATSMGAVTSDAPIDALVNLAGTTDGDPRYLKAKIILEYDGKNTALGTELRNRVPQFKDLFINYLSNVTLAEAGDPGARDKISKDMLRIINDKLPTKLGEVKNVLFTDFVIQ